MEITIEHPTGRPNFTRVSIGAVDLWFSYRTCVGFHTYASGLVVRENDWGPTTGKHLNYLQPDKRDRVSGEKFREMLAAFVTRHFDLEPQT